MLFGIWDNLLDPLEDWMTVGICATVHLTQHQSTNNKFGLMLGEGRGGLQLPTYWYWFIVTVTQTDIA